ncbi:MAG: 50S ribosomal protein L1 [Candidatus Nanohaloarchaea archaeon]
MDFEEAVEKAIEEAPERNFKESIDVVVNFKDLDLSEASNRFNEDIKLPYQASEDVKIAVIGDTLVKNADNADREITEDELEELYENPSDAKDLAEEMSFIIAEAPLMPDIGQHLGQVFGPRNMMPDPMPPGSDPTDRIESLRNTITVRLKEDPVIHLKVGNEEQDIDQVARNASAVYDFIEGELPQGRNNIKSVLIKTTMGPSVEVSN